MLLILSQIYSSRNAEKEGDDKFLENCKRAFPVYPKSKFSPNTSDPRTFELYHYAGKVTYKVDGFAKLNNDQLSPSLFELMKTSQNGMVRRIFSDIDDYSSTMLSAKLGAGTATSSRHTTMSTMSGVNSTGE